MNKIILLLAALSFSHADYGFNINHIVEEVARSGERYYRDSIPNDYPPERREIQVENSGQLHFPLMYEDLFSLDNCDKVIDDLAWTACYRNDMKLSTVISYKLRGSDLRSGYIEKRPDFYGDNRVRSKYRAQYGDYSRSGYDRGHSRSHASTAWDRRLLYHTYSMVNIWPQRPSLNRDIWIKAEKYERLIARELGMVNVVNIADTRGSTETIGRHRVLVPRGFYKIIYNDRADFRKCFYYRNIDSNPAEDTFRSHEIDCRNIRY